MPEEVNKLTYMLRNIKKEKETPVPSNKDREKFQSLELEILSQATKALKGHRLVEAHFLIWASVEQFMLPNLVIFVASKLEIIIPKDALDVNFVHLVKYYYFLSHDKELFQALEKARKNRNKLTHELHKQTDWKNIKKSFKESMKKDISTLLSLFQDRFNGKTAIPSLALYTKGWNDALSGIVKKMEKEIKDIKALDEKTVD